MFCTRVCDCVLRHTWPVLMHSHAVALVWGVAPLAWHLLLVRQQGGDAFLQECVWEAGFGITDPGFSFRHPRLHLFDGFLERQARCLK